MPTVSKIQQLFYEFNALYLLIYLPGACVMLSESQFADEKSLKNTLLFANALFINKCVVF